MWIHEFFFFIQSSLLIHSRIFFLLPKCSSCHLLSHFFFIIIILCIFHDPFVYISKHTLRRTRWVSRLNKQWNLSTNFSLVARTHLIYSLVCSGKETSWEGGKKYFRIHKINQLYCTCIFLSKIFSQKLTQISWFISCFSGLWELTDIEVEKKNAKHSNIHRLLIYTSVRHVYKDFFTSQD